MWTGLVVPPADRLFAACGWTEARAPRALIFVAHPDDETIAIGGHLATLTQPLVVHATDGAPRNLNDARAQGFADAAAYAAARGRELRAAMRIVGVGEEALLTLGFSDQGACENLAALTRAFAALLAERRPDVVLTHAYEGGHPDHDAVAFAARAALRLREAERQEVPLLIEAPFYHSEAGEPVRQRFAPAPLPPFVVSLPASARATKRRMYDAHATQRETLTLFHTDEESFRPAPRYDFAQPPNGGEIFYETFGWDITNARFLALAREALKELGLPP